MSAIVTKRDEWARFWPLPVVAMLGITGPAAFAFSSGIFMGEMTREFGWSKTQFGAALTLQMLLGLVVGPLAARVLDRVGGRRMLLAGIVPFALALSLLGQANGALWQWCLLGGVYCILTAVVIPAAWVSGVVASFDVARGLAMAVCLAGIGLATAMWPPLVAWLVVHVGWRHAYPIMGLGWALVVLPLVFVFYKPAAKRVPLVSAPALPPLWPIVRSQTFICMICAGGLFASVQLALIIHLVPILRLQGLGLTAAGNLAGLVGLFSIIGRIGTGALLDFVPSRPLALCAFLLPLPVMALLVWGNGTLGVLMLASALLGLASGSETDVVAYLCSRRFDTRVFGSVYTLFQTGFAIAASLGPLLAGWLFDRNHSYLAYYACAVIMVLVATVLIMLVPHENPALRRGSTAD